MKRSAVLIAGPTASGKSALAAAFARRHDGVVINADSMQVYRDLAILTARPGAGEMAAVPHRLYGILDAAEACSAARWRDLAMSEIRAAWTEGRLPVLTGGTGLYFRALLEGLAPVPRIDADIRARLRRDMAKEGPEAMHARLAARDPALAARLQQRDRQRIARALEVLESTGRSLADFRQEMQGGRLADEAGQVIRLVLTLPRPDLHARIDARFDAMMASGALKEVRRLTARGLDPALPAMKALGVPPLLRHLAGKIGLADAVAEAKGQTRRYAKRQTTWFNTQFSDWPRADARDPAAALALLESALTPQPGRTAPPSPRGGGARP